MYGRDEYRYYVNRCTDTVTALQDQRDGLRLLIDEAREDFNGQARTENRVTNEDERAVIDALRAARVMVGEAQQAIDRAVSALPVIAATASEAV